MADVPKIVIRRLASRTAQATPQKPHPDANLLAAFVEQSLADGERLEVLDHLAQCFECREVVELAGPELAVAGVAPEPVSAPWLSWPVLRWGAAIACVIVVGAAVTLRQRELRHAATGEGKPAPVSAPAMSSPKSEALPSTGAMAVEPVPKAENLPQAVQPGKRNRTAELMAPAATATMVPGRAKEDLGLAGSSGANPMMAGGMAMSWATPTTTLSLKTRAMPIPRWALTADGTLQRSFDIGRSWEPITVSLEASLRALAANGLDIWVGGSAGALYHSEDAGEHWVKVQPISDGRPLTADIIGVEFTDFEHGRLNTASGDIWITEDAGLTWQKQ